MAQGPVGGPGVDKKRLAIAISLDSGFQQRGIVPLDLLNSPVEIVSFEMVVNDFSAGSADVAPDKVCFAILVLIKLSRNMGLGECLQTANIQAIGSDAVN